NPAAVPAEKDIRNVVVMGGVRLFGEQVFRLQESIRIHLGGEREIAGVTADECPLTRQPTEVRVRPTSADPVAPARSIERRIASARKPDFFVLVEAIILRVPAGTCVVLNADGPLSPTVDLYILLSVRVVPEDRVLMRFRHPEILDAADAGSL